MCTAWLSGLLQLCSQGPSASSPLECHRLSQRKLFTRALLGISSVMSCFAVDSLVWGLASKSGPWQGGAWQSFPLPRASRRKSQLLRRLFWGERGCERLGRRWWSAGTPGPGSTVCREKRRGPAAEPDPTTVKPQLGILCAPAVRPGAAEG